MTIHQGADKVGIDSRPRELVPLITLTLHGEVAGHPEGERRPCREGPAQVGCQVGQQVLFETGDFVQ